MKFILTLILVFFYFNIGFSQEINISKNIEVINNNELQIISILSTSAEISSIKIQNYQMLDQDSLVVFEGNFNISDFDAGNFYSFSKENNTYHFGLGFFENGTYVTKILIIKNDNSNEEFSIQ
jgi:hypothetical protein